MVEEGSQSVRADEMAVFTREDGLEIMFVEGETGSMARILFARKRLHQVINTLTAWERAFPEEGEPA